MTNGKKSGANSAFEKLLEYELRSVEFTPSSSSSDGPSREWSGLTFGLGGSRLTCNISQVTEIIPCPDSTPVPGAKSWIMGLANIRGELLTVVDLGGFLTGKNSTLSSSSRLLTTTLNKAPIGLLIDEVFGQRHFLDTDSAPCELPDDSPLQKIVERQHSMGTETWQELNLDQLFNTAEFLNGAAD